MSHEARQVLEVAPEAVDLFRRTIHDACAFRVNALVVPLLSCIAQITSSAVTASTFAVANATRPSFASGVSAGNAETGEIQRIAGDARPHCLSWFLLSKDCDARSDFAQTVQSYQTGAPFETPEMLAMNFGASSSVRPSPN